MNHGTVITMFDTENQKTPNSLLKCNVINNNLIANTASNNFNMCLREPKIVLDKNVVAQYFKARGNTHNITTSKLERENQFLVTSKKCVDRMKNKLSVKKVLPNKNMLGKEKEVVLAGQIFSQNNRFFQNINEYIAKQSIALSNSSTKTLDNHDKVQSSNKSKSEGNKSTRFIEEEPVDLECGDDILYTNGNSYYDENVMNTVTEQVEMECGDDILYENDTNYYGKDAVTAEDSFEMECGDDILYMDGAGYYSNADEDCVNGNQDFSYSYEDVETNVPNDEFKPKSDIKNCNSPISDTFEKQESEFYYDQECNYKTFIKQEFKNHTISQNLNFVNENSCATCEKCNRTFESSSLLKEHQFETCGLNYFYTCKFCPSTSWYSSTLKKHIEIVHSRELDKENIDDIMETIKRSKQLESDQYNELNFEKQVDFIQARKKTTEIPVKRIRQTKNKKIYIKYKEVQRILKISCLECNKDPEYVRGRTNQYCSQCHNEYTYQCRKCSRFYFKYKLALLHAKGDCKKNMSKKSLTSNSLLKNVQEKPSSSSILKYITTFCGICNEWLEQNERNTKTTCPNCNNTSIQFKCEICKQIFLFKTTAKHHSQMCHKQWQNSLIHSSLSTNALCDHNYFRKYTSEPRVNKIHQQIEQQEFIEIMLSHKPAKRVYTRKKGLSNQS